jgi:hypothetical protein
VTVFGTFGRLLDASSAEADCGATEARVIAEKAAESAVAATLSRAIRTTFDIWQSTTFGLRRNLQAELAKLEAKRRSARAFLMEAAEAICRDLGVPFEVSLDRRERKGTAAAAVVQLVSGLCFRAFGWHFRAPRICHTPFL